MTWTAKVRSLSGGIVLLLAVALPFLGFFKALAHEWFQSEVFSYGVVVPVITAYLIWRRRGALAQREAHPSSLGLVFILLGCAFRIMGELGGILLVSGAGLILILIGGTIFLWGSSYARVVALPLAFLIFMVPWPSYTLGTVSWRLQGAASAASATVLELLGIPVFRDGNLLLLPDYTFAVEEACSGTRSLFALMALAGTIGLTAEHRWVSRLLLLAAAPGIAVLANVVRIVGTGMAAHWLGDMAAQQSLHTAWGIVVFALEVVGLLSLYWVLRWFGERYTSPSS